MACMKESKRPTTRSMFGSEDTEETPRILSSEEKRELILAHARSQTGKDPLQRMTVWGGVMIAMAGIAVGWWWTVGANIQQNAQNGSPEFRQMAENLNEFTQTVKSETDSLQKPLNPTSNANAGEASGLLKAVLEGDGSKKRRDDLLAPPSKNSVQATSTASASSTASSDTNTPSQLIDPETPGLTPEQ